MGLIALSKKNNPRGWVKLGDAAKELDITIPDMYQDVEFLIEILPDTAMQEFQKKYMEVGVIDSGKQGATPIRDVALKQNELAERLTNYIHDCEGYYILEKTTEAEWDALPTDKRHPEARPRRGNFFKKTAVPFSRPAIREFVMRDLVNFIIALFFRKAQIMKQIELVEFEEEVKN